MDGLFERPVLSCSDLKFRIVNRARRKDSPTLFLLTYSVSKVFSVIYLTVLYNCSDTSVLSKVAESPSFKAKSLSFLCKEILNHKPVITSNVHHR